jgi:Cof subfamily protein (haloacid dehalogenase superfamily)
VIRLLAIDIDGTLLDSRGKLPDAHREALADAAARGIAIALVTGRSFHFTGHVVEALGFPVTVITNNGAVVKDRHGQTVMKHVLPTVAARHVLASTHGFEEHVAIVFDRSDERQIVFEHMDWTHPNRRGYFEKNKRFIAAQSPLADALTEDPIQLMFNGGVTHMRELARQLRAMAIADQFSIALTEYELRDFSLLDINAAGCTKGSTLRKWAELNAIRREDVMAVGDNLNDVEMLEFAGIAVLMGNAVPELKARGYRLTGSNDEGGLATAIRSALTPNLKI